MTRLLRIALEISFLGIGAGLICGGFAGNTPTRVNCTLGLAIWCAASALDLGIRFRPRRRS